MLQQIFKTILEMSITAGYCAVFVMVIRFFMKKLPRSYSYVLWAAVFLRLLLPFAPESNWSLIPRMPEGELAITGQQSEEKSESKTYGEKQGWIPGVLKELEDGANEAAVSETNKATVQESDASANTVAWIGPTLKNPAWSDSALQTEAAVADKYRTEAAALNAANTEVTEPVPAGWILVAVLLLTWGFISNALFERKLKNARMTEDGVYEMEGLSTAFVTGIFRPRIYLPSDLPGSYRKYVLAHERTHIKRGDNLIKQAAYFLTCLHWFNPLVWLSFYLMCQDMEMSCDERVLRTLGMQEKQSYSMALLSMASGRKLQLGIPLAFGRTNTKSRIKHVLKYRKPKVWAAFIAGSVIVAVTAGLLSNPGERVVNAEAETLKESSSAEQDEEAEAAKSEETFAQDNYSEGEPTNTESYTGNYASSDEGLYLNMGQDVPEEIDGKKVITLGIPCGDSDVYGQVSEVVNNYNAQSSSCHVVIVEFTKEWEELVSLQGEVMKVFKQGEGTDIVYIPGLEKEELAMAGLLTDLKEFIPQEDWDTVYVGNVLDATAIGDKLYTIGSHFSVLALAADERLAGTDTGWSMQEMTSFLNTRSGGVHALTRFSADETDIQTMGSFSMTDFIDWETGSCNFEKEEFYRILEFCKERETTAASGEILAEYIFLPYVAEYQLYNEIYEGNLQIKGFPTESGSGVAAIMYDELGIYSASENKEAAWDFIQYYLQEKDTVCFFPIVQERLEACFEQAMTPEYAGGWELPKKRSQDIKVYAASETDVQAVKDIIALADREFDYNDTYIKILEEEVMPYYRGEIDIGETVARIETRMNAYLEEFK